MSTRGESVGRARAEPAALCLAAGGFLAWFVLCAVLKPEWIADEQRHLLAIRWLAEGRPLPDGFLPMLPAYHAAVAILARAFGPSLLLARSVNLALALASLLLVRAIARRRQTPAVGTALLLYAWNPLLFPYTSLAYTELAALVPLLAACYLHLRRRYGLSAAAVLVAGLVRQSSVIWAAFFAGWIVLDAWPASAEMAGGRERPRRVFAAVGPAWPHLALLAVAAGVFAVRPSFAAGQAYANRAALNVAQFYLFGLVVGLLWAPLWLAELKRCWSDLILPALSRARSCAALVAAVGLLEMGFANPHPWNGDPLYLRNWPLMAMLTSLPARAVACTALVLLGLLAFAWGRAQPERRLLAWLTVCTLAFLGPHWLVDPRYYLVPAVFFNLLALPAQGRTGRLAGWYAVLTAALTTYILVRGSPHGGVL